MIGLALVLVGFAVADLAAGGLAGDPLGRGRAVAGIGCGLLASGSGALFAGFGVVPSACLLALTALGVGPWVLLRIPRSGVRPGARRAAWALAALGATLIAAVALTPLWTQAQLTGAQRWLGELPFPSLQGAGIERLGLAAGTFLFLAATANGIVRAVLSVAGTEIGRGEERLRGGRFIGVIERILIFGLAATGEPTAAALVVSAKSLLRFPELSKAARESAEPDHEASRGRLSLMEDVDVVTEYFLLGSLTSWLVALAPVLLLR